MKLNWDKYGIDPSRVSGGKTYCPKCHNSRKHKRDKSLSVDLKTGMFNCHNPGCEFRGCAIEYDRPKKEYLKPLPRLEKLGGKALDWFENTRKISNDTLLRMKVTETKEWMPQFEREVPVICFNYYRDGELVNIKFRGPQKSFKMAKDAEMIFYNMDGIKDEEEVIIVEGEIDALTLKECGIHNVVSVPNGASGGSMKLEYLDNCWRDFEDKKKIVIATDDDEPGLALREELARRLGKERCWQITYPEGKKDANEVFLASGKDAVKDLILQAVLWPLEGIATMHEMFGTVLAWYQQGYPKGARSGVPGLDELITFAPKQVTTWTGIPGHGKDEYTNGVMVGLSVNSGWKWGDIGFEEENEQTVTKLIEKKVGKSFDFRKDESKRMTQNDFEEGIFFVDQHFYFVKTEEVETNIDSLLEVADGLVVRYGIQGLRINPFNWIDNDSGTDGTEYVSQFFSKIIKWCRKRNVHIFLIAHTTKISKDKSGKFEIPNLYSISGSAHFYNKTHNGITVYLDAEKKIVTIYVQKVKQSWLGQKGYVSYTYDILTRQYYLSEVQPQHPDFNKMKEMPKTLQLNFANGNYRPLTSEESKELHQSEDNEMPF